MISTSTTAEKELNRRCAQETVVGNAKSCRSPKGYGETLRGAVLCKAGQSAKSPMAIVDLADSVTSASGCRSVSRRTSELEAKRPPRTDKAEASADKRPPATPLPRSTRSSESTRSDPLVERWCRRGRWRSRGRWKQSGFRNQDAAPPKTRVTAACSAPMVSLERADEIIEGGKTSQAPRRERFVRSSYRRDEPGRRGSPSGGPARCLEGKNVAGCGSAGPSFR